MRMTSAMGTDEYKAPEILDEGNQLYGMKVDVYSAGYILYEMLTSENLIEAEKKKREQNDMQPLLRTVEKDGGWQFDHPAIAGKYFWLNLLGKML